MRSLAAALTTEQQKDSVTPYINVNFRSRDRVTRRSFDTGNTEVIGHTEGGAIESFNQWFGQSIVPLVDTLVDSIVLRLTNVDAGNISLDVSIRATSSRIPTGSDLEPLVTVAVTPGANQDVTFTFAGTLELKSGVEYAIVSRVNGGTNVNLRWIRDFLNSTDAYPDGRPSNSADGVSWSTFHGLLPNNTTDFMFTLNGRQTLDVLSVVQGEGEPGRSIMSVSGYPISTIIRLLDGDGSLEALEWRGYRAEIDWGFDISGTPQFSRAGPSFVFNQKTVDRDQFGRRILELYCMSQWDLADHIWPNNALVDPIRYDGTRTVRHIMMDLLGGGDPGAVIVEDDSGPSWVDETAAAKDDTANDVELVPASPAVGDAVFFGKSTRFDRTSIDLTTVGSATWTWVWEYWNGSAWSTLTTITGTNNIKTFTKGELQCVDFDMPSDWAAVDYTTVEGAFPVSTSLYYIRARISAFTSMTTRPEASRITLGQDFGVWLDTSDASQGDDFKPVLDTDYRMGTSTLVAMILGYTQMEIIIANDGFHMAFIDNAQASPDYSYDGDHAYWTSGKEVMPVLPNTIIYTDREPGASGAAVTASANDSDSVTAFGTITQIRVDESIQVTQDATDLATREIAQYIRRASQGKVLIPIMHVGQELYDQVQITDNNTAVANKGRVTKIIRTFEAGKFNMEMSLGGFGEGIWTDRGTVDQTEITAGLTKSMDDLETMFHREIEIRRLLDEGRSKVVPRAVPRRVLARSRQDTGGLLEHFPDFTIAPVLRGGEREFGFTFAAIPSVGDTPTFPSIPSVLTPGEIRRHRARQAATDQQNRVFDIPTAITREGVRLPTFTLGNLRTPTFGVTPLVDTPQVPFAISDPSSSGGRFRRGNQITGRQPR